MISSSDFRLPKSPLRAGALILAATSYIAVGVAHFTHEDFFLSIMPPYLPAPLWLVWISGIFEVLGGLGLLYLPSRLFASRGLVALLVAVYPANIHMALNAEEFASEGYEPWTLYARLPFQFVFIAWALWVGRPDTPSSAEQQD